MLLSVRDVDLLRFLYWCQYMRYQDMAAVSSEAEVSNLIGCGYIKQYASGSALVLTIRGKQLLQELLKDELPTITRSYHERAIERRLRLSRLMMVAYMASIPVFTNTPAQLISAPSLFLTTITRGKGGDPWGGTRVGALLHLPDVVAAVHYVCTGIGNVSPVDEISVLANQSAVVKDGDRAFFFAGDSYDEILKELSLMNGDENSKLVSYGTAWRTMPFPVYLLPCGKTGARQLRIMSIPNYRQWASQCLLQAEYEPPPDGQPDWDGMYQGRPFVMAADMDLRRIDRAIAAAERAEYDCISMAAMDVQGQEVLQPRYMDTGKARL